MQNKRIQATPIASDDIVSENGEISLIDFTDHIAPTKQQAVAVQVTSNATFYRCSFSSYQDTIYAHSLCKFYREYTVQGTVNFIFGNADHCTREREDPNQNTGISLQNCTIVAAPELVEAWVANFSAFLGGPWRTYSITMVMKTYLGGSNISSRLA
ncbi:hypothetical protein Sjap_017991 [Stephania japonica]|uniref:Pectinesterase catalytic domain-containing protein n=1 Tax=Stephania japonica TaxID=461633 RepID=A0AAP0NMN2_9MAGN